MIDVVVVGAGPVGTLLAGELARRGVDVRLVERRGGDAVGTRAIGVHAPVLAALEASGVTARLLDAARRVHAGEARVGGRTIGVVRFDRLSRRFPFVATLPQPATQRALALHAPAPVHADVVALRPRTGGVRVLARAAASDLELDARVVVDAGGPRARGLVFRPGALRVRESPHRYAMADIAASGPDVAVVHLDARGVLESFPLPGGLRRFVAPVGSAEGDPASALAAALRARGEGEAADAVGAASVFSLRRAIAPRLRHDRVFVIGDAAHEISPMGGQGMNLGLLDAATLAPLLAAWLRTGVEPADALRRWESRRLRSARTAATIAAANTALGRPAGARAAAARHGMLRIALATPLALFAAHAYAMGLDADA